MQQCLFWLLQLFMHYGYIWRWGHVPCCWLGEAVWLEIPMSFYKLLGFMHMEQCQEPKLCLKYLLNTSQYLLVLSMAIKLCLWSLSRSCSMWPGFFHGGFPSSLPSLVSSSAAAVLRLYFERKPSSSQLCSLADDKDQTSVLEISSNEQQLLGRVSLKIGERSCLLIVT